MTKLNTALPYTVCTNKKTKQLSYLQGGKTFSRQDFDKAIYKTAEEVEEVAPIITQKIVGREENPEPTTEIDIFADVEKVKDADVKKVVDTKKLDNTVADPSQDGVDEVKLYNRKQDAKTAITRNKWAAEDYDILPYQEKWIIQKKAE